MSRLKFLKRLAPLLALGLIFLSGCEGVLKPQSPEGREQYGLIMLSFLIMLVVMVVVFAIYFYVLIRFRKRKGQTGYPEQVEGNHKLEIIWTVIPFILVIILTVPTVMYTFKFAKDYSKDEASLHVKVTAHQFWWEFEYPEYGIITANDLVVPVNKRTAVTLDSADVIHSFWVPDLAGKQDNNPASNKNRLSFTPEEARVYKGKCAELCGASHALMDFKVIAMEQADFEAWVAHMTAPKVVSEDAAVGEEVFASKCMSCHAVSATDRNVAPNLDNFANRETLANFRPNNEEWLRKWIEDPQAVKPGNAMPALGLTDQEMDDVVKYLQSLK